MIIPRHAHILRSVSKSMRHNCLASAANLFTLTVCLIFLGGFLMLAQTVLVLVPPWMEDGTAVAQLRPQASAEDRDRLVKEIQEWSEIEEVRTVSVEEALAPLQTRMEEWQDVLEGVGKDLLPASLEVRIKPRHRDGGDKETILTRIRGFQEVEKVYCAEVRAGSIQSVMGVLQVAFLGAAGLLSLAVVFVAFNGTKLAFSTRRDEAEILGLVGATPLSVKMPFYIEEALHGVVSAMLAATAVTTAVFVSRQLLPPPIVSILSLKSFNVPLFLGMLLGCGTLLSLAGCWLALRHCYEYK